MSSFLVSKTTIDACVAAIHHKATYHRDHGMLYATTMDTLGKDLWAMNNDAVTARYNDSAEALANDAKIAGYRYKTIFLSDVQLLKSVECLIYQCSEGNIPERELFKQLENVVGLLKDRIISDLPVYKSAKWDL